MTPYTAWRNHGRTAWAQMRVLAFVLWVMGVSE